MDDLAKYNKARWEELAQANVQFSRPFLDLDAASARQVVDAEGMLDDVAGKSVLCLASGGGQQSAAFGLMGAKTTVFDLSETQLERDRIAADHYGLDTVIIQGDMRDLSCFDDDAFDVVWHAFSINFVPETRPVFAEVRRIIRQGGLYRLQYFNPYLSAVDEDGWDGHAYPLKAPYIDGADIAELFPFWDVDGGDGSLKQIESPREFRHALSTVINGLVGEGFVILGLWEERTQNLHAEPGTWEHFKHFAPPFLTIWSAYRPEVFKQGVRSRQ